MQQAITKAIAKLEEAVSAEGDEAATPAATPAALIIKIKAALAKATEVGVLPGQIDTAAAETRIKELEDQRALRAKEQAITNAITKLKEAVEKGCESGEAAGALIRAIKAALAKATEVGVLPGQIDTAAAEARIAQLEKQKLPKKRKRSSATVQTSGGVSTTPCPAADETSAHAVISQQQQQE